MYDMHYAKKLQEVLSVPLNLFPFPFPFPFSYTSTCTLTRQLQPNTHCYLTSGAGLFGRFAKTDGGGAKFQTMTSPSSTSLALLSLFQEQETPDHRPAQGKGRGGREGGRNSPDPDMIMSSDN